MICQQNQSIIFLQNRCVQCGTCLAACHSGSLTAEVQETGLWKITHDNTSCDGCMRCIMVCPARLLPNLSLSEEFLSRLLDVRLAYSRDNKERWKSSSGGAGRTLIKGALEKGLVDAVYTLKKTADYPWTEGTYYYRPSDTHCIPNSIYHPVLVNRNLTTDAKAKRILLVGTACQILAAQKLLRYTSGDITTIAIFCKQQKTLEATTHLARRLRVDFSTEASCGPEYRGQGWPGRFTIGERSIAWEVAAAVVFGKRLWRVPGCRFCPNPMGVGVDITLADPWGLDASGQIGKSMAMVWTDRGKALINANGDILATEGLDRQLLAGSIDMAGIIRKQNLAAYYLGKKVSLRTSIAGAAERLQTAALESILKRWNIPDFAHKVLGRMPDLPSLII